MRSDNELVRIRIRAARMAELPVLQEIEQALLEHAAGRAATGDIGALTLTTFAQVPWNAPYYARCGFRVLDEAELTPGLRAIRHREAGLGLDRWPRVCMRRDL
jgi:hypothetical protein